MSCYCLEPGWFVGDPIPAGTWQYVHIFLMPHQHIFGLTCPFLVFFFIIFISFLYLFMTFEVFSSEEWTGFTWWTEQPIPRMLLHVNLIGWLTLKINEWNIFISICYPGPPLLLFIIITEKGSYETHQAHRKSFWRQYSATRYWELGTGQKQAFRLF